MQTYYRFFLAFSAFFASGITLLSANQAYTLYGNNLETWTNVLIVNMLAIFFGNFVASLTVKRIYSFSKILGFISLAAAVYIILFTFPLIQTSEIFQESQFITILFFLFIPVFLMSLIPIIFIHKECVEYKKSESEVSANIFFLSTFSAVPGFLFVGFFLLPNLGYQKSTLLLSLLMAISATIFFREAHKMGYVITTFVFLSLLLLHFVFTEKPKQRSMQLKESGLLGQIVVEDDSLSLTRNLYLNGLSQSIIRYDTYESQYDYVKRIYSMTKNYPSGSRALILGVGGGTLANRYIQLGYQVDVVELDERIIDAAFRFFNFKKDKVHLRIDDARHFLNITQYPYDIIVFDTYTGDNSPSYLITRESCERLKMLLNRNGKLCLYFPGSIDKKIIRATNMFYQTLVQSGFNTKVYARSYSFADVLLFECRKEKFTDAINEVCINDLLKPDQTIEVYSDDKPLADYLFKYNRTRAQFMRKRF